MKSFLCFQAFLMILILSGCQNSSSDNKQLAPLTDSNSATGVTGDSVKLVKTASINFKVAEVTKSTRAISDFAKSLGVMIYHQSLTSTHEDRKEFKISTDSLLVIATSTTHADVTARIPSQNLEQFINAVSDLGYFTNNSQLDIVDNSFVYLENYLKRKSRIDVLAQPQVTKNQLVSKLHTIDIKDKVIEQEIANKSIDADANYSLVNLTVYQNAVVNREMIANYILSDYKLPFMQRLGNALSEGWQYFLLLLLALLHLWMFILLTIIGFLSYRYWQKRKVSALSVKGE